MDTVATADSFLNIEMSDLIATVPSQTIRKPRIWTVFVTWLIAAIVGQVAVFASFVMAGIAMGFVMGAQGMDAATIQSRVQEMLQQPLLVLLLSLPPFQFGMGAMVLLAARWSKQPFQERLGLTPQSGRTIGAFRLVTMAAFTVSAALASLIGSTMFLGEPPTNVIGAAMTDGPWWTITLLTVILSVIPALVEETVFRGYIQRRLLQRWSPGASIGVTTLLFAILHADSLQHIFAVIPLGVVTGLVAYRTNSVKPGMIVHAIHNVAAVGIGPLVKALTPLIGNEGVGLVVIATIVTLGLIGLPAIISLVRRAQTRNAEMSYFVSPPVLESFTNPAV